MVARVDVGSEKSDFSADVVLADAAAWVARLQRGDRSHADEAAFQDWLRNPRHAQAFARVSDLWEILPGAARSRPAAPLVGTAGARRPVRAAATWAAASLAAAVIGGGLLWLARAEGYRTAIGQQQVVTLADETRVALNTDTHLTVHYSARERRIDLDRGEALFEVTRAKNRAFVVQVGEMEVHALGTEFDVRRSEGRAIVVLLEGSVEVTAKTRSGSNPVVATMTPGERLTLGMDDGIVAVDRPNVEAAIAWRRGEVMFDDVSLGEALAEMNRYASVHVSLGDPKLRDLRVSGVFESQSAVEFAETIAALHHLEVNRHGNDLIITAPPSAQ